jgi:hypothetical protein
VPARAFAPGLAIVLGLAAEFRRANAATERFEQLRGTARAREDAETSPARRVFVEFYAEVPIRLSPDRGGTNAAAFAMTRLAARFRYSA